VSQDAELSFEQARAELERIVRLWERGEDLYRTCLAKLDAAEGKIEELGRRAEAVKPAGS
jgi:exonuclease VII small subunit